MAVLDGELAVPCTRNPLQRGRTPPREPAQSGLSMVQVLKARPCAAERFQPRQVRKEAPVRSFLWVPQARWA